MRFTCISVKHTIFTLYVNRVAKKIKIKNKNIIISDETPNKKPNFCLLLLPIYRSISTFIRKNKYNCQEVYMITKRDFILSGSYICAKYDYPIS